MNAEHELLASAYLDGELTDDERRLADADPAVMADVERLRALRAGVAAVDPPAAAARERAISAALTAYGELHGASSTPSSSTPSSSTPSSSTPSSSTLAPSADDERRTDLTRWLGVAAAVVAVGLLGAVVAGQLGSDDDADQSAVAPAEGAAEEPAAEVLAAPAPTLQGTELDTDASRLTESADDGEAEMTMAEEPAAAEAAEEPASEPGDEFADMSADAPTGGDEGPAADDATASTFPTAAILEPEAYLDGEPIRSPAELAAVGEHLLDLLDRRELPPTPNHACPVEDVLARGVFADGDENDIYIAVNPDVRTVVAIDEETCRVLLLADLEP